MLRNIKRREEIQEISYLNVYLWTFSWILKINIIFLNILRQNSQYIPVYPIGGVSKTVRIHILFRIQLTLHASIIHSSASAPFRSLDPTFYLAY